MVSPFYIDKGNMHLLMDSTKDIYYYSIGWNHKANFLTFIYSFNTNVNNRKSYKALIKDPQKTSEIMLLDYQWLC